MQPGPEANSYGIKLKEVANQARDLVRSLDPTVSFTKINTSE